MPILADSVNFIDQIQPLMRRSFIIACLAGVALAGKAQLNIGLKGGINISNQVNPFINTYSIKPSYDRGEPVIVPNGGMFTEITLGKRIYLRVLVGLSGQGYDLPASYDSIGQRSPVHNVRIGYASLPVQLNYFIDTKIGRVWVGVGPYAAMIVGGKIQLPNTKLGIKTGYKPPAQFKPFDFGISPTFGLKLKNGILFGIDYNMGLSDVSPADDKNRNVSWSFYVGYVFNNH